MIHAAHIISPPLIAQRDDVFGDIQCTGLTVVDKSGQPAIELSVDKDNANSIRINDTAGKIAIGMIATNDNDLTINGLHIFDKDE